MPVEGIGTGAEYMDMTIAEGAVGSTSTMMEGMTEEQMQQESGGETEGSVYISKYCILTVI